jgi:hypothetical protein
MKLSKLEEIQQSTRVDDDGGGGVGGGRPSRVDIGAATSTGGIVRPASASMTARLDQGGGNILAAVMQGGGVVALMGAGGEK